MWGFHNKYEESLKKGCGITLNSLSGLYIRLKPITPENESLVDLDIVVDRQFFFLRLAHVGTKNRHVKADHFPYKAIEQLFPIGGRIPWHVKVTRCMKIPYLEQQSYVGFVALFFSFFSVVVYTTGSYSTAHVS